jgi:hypothetical protein
VERNVALDLAVEAWYDGYQFIMDGDGGFKLLNISDDKLKEFIDTKLIFIPSLFDYVDGVFLIQTVHTMNIYCTAYSFVADSLLSLDTYSIFYGSNVQYVSLKSCNYLSDCCFSNCKSLSEIIIDKIVTIEHHCFCDCVNLSKINLSNVKYIGDLAFCNCTSLDITNPEFNKLMYLGQRAFYGASINGMIAPKLETIRDSAFASSMITSFSGQQVKEIGKEAFKTSKLTDINVPNVKYLAYNCFSFTKIKEFISDSVTYVSKSFDSCFYLKVLELSGLENLDETIALDCPELEKIVLNSCSSLNAVLCKRCKEVKFIYLSKLDVLSLNLIELNKRTKVFVKKDIEIKENGKSRVWCENRMAMINYLG